MNNSSSAHCDIDFSAGQTFISVLYGCVFCIGLPSNCLALYGLYLLIKADYGLPVSVMNLLLADLIQIVTLPLWMDYYSIQLEWRFGDTSCWIITFMFYLSLYASISFMCFITLERYIAIVHPLWFKSLHKLRTTCFLCLGIWVTTMLLVFTSVYNSLNNIDGACRKNYPSNKNFAVFRLVTLSVSFLLPFVLLLFFFFRVRERLADDTLMARKDKERITGLLLLIMVIFMLVFGPYCVVHFINYLGTIVATDSCVYESRLFRYCQVSLALLSLNSLLDPILYIFLRNDVRDLLNSIPCYQRLNHWKTPQTDQGHGGSRNSITDTESRV